MRARPLTHMIKIDHGDLPRRIETCPLRFCSVDDTDGTTTCEHLACINCGIGPPVYLDDDKVFFCDVCATRWNVPESLRT